MIIDGRKIASDIIAKLKLEVSKLPFQPVFCDILVGDNPVSAQYMNLKAKKATECGIKFLRADFSKQITTAGLISEIQKLNRVKNMRGLIVQLPLPLGINVQDALNAIDWKIDVDCIGYERRGRFYRGDLEIIPPTAAAVLYVLDGLKLDLANKSILVIGQGELVGRPVSHLLRKRGLNIKTADSLSLNSGELIKQADVIISAVGKPKLIIGSKVKSGAVIIDAGTVEDGGEIVGDVDFESVKNIVSAVSPVPGGIGPVTVAMLLANVVKLAKQEQKNYSNRAS